MGSDQPGKASENAGQNKMESRKGGLSKKDFATSHIVAEDTSPCMSVEKGEEQNRWEAERDLVAGIGVVHGLVLEHSCSKDLLDAY